MHTLTAGPMELQSWGTLKSSGIQQIDTSQSFTRGSFRSFLGGQNNPKHEGRLGPDWLRTVPKEKGQGTTRDAIRASGACSKVIRPTAFGAASE